MRVNPHDEDAWPGIVLLCDSVLLSERFKKKLEELGFTGDLYLACTPAEVLAWERRCLCKTLAIWSPDENPWLWFYIGTCSRELARRSTVVGGRAPPADLYKTTIGFGVPEPATDIETLAINALTSFRRGG